ncbi:MAG TPA: ATP-grasp domain-containing protein [Polyangiaceae bacterium]|jgi:biotin carboxylase
MKTLLLTPFASRTMPIAEWLGPDVGRDVVLVAPANVAGDYTEWAAKVVPIERYAPFGEVDCVALRLAREHRVERVVAIGECDILRAAQLRRMLDLPGQSVESALAFRDKGVMKQIVGAAGIAVPEHIVATSPLDVIAFVERVGLPVVGKPFAGQASIGTIILRERTEVEAVLGIQPEIRGLVEKFVPGDMFHVDGFVHHGEAVLVSPSRYVNGMLAFQEGKHCLSVQLDAAHPQHARLVAFARSVLAAMPLPEATPFHLEVFHTPDDRLVFCEIASRVAGIRIGDAITQSFGFNLAKTWLEFQLGLRTHVEPPPPRKKAAGTAVVPPETGRLDAFPRTLEAPGVVDVHVEFKEGDVLKGADSSAAALAVILAEGEAEAQVVARLEDAVAAFREGCRYSATE